ncbi:MAG: isoprenoid biosynthesis glyoxalase ElbB [Candidatus Hatepunaea meridiana]|nr:isoprenoid biosynthesis glyoxalase ElbB [Candidatus Hatepunaea meridiana]
MSKRIGVILSGCGVYDGAEIHESVITLLALDRAGADVIIMAPDKDQMHVINHQTGEVSEGETRNVLIESARIARGPVRNVAEVKVDELDALVLPGGFGAAKNLCDFAVKGADCSIDGGVSNLIQAMHKAGKPIVAMCIAPAVAMKALTNTGVKPTLTIGTDPDTAAGLEAMGGSHENQDVRGVAIDETNKIISTPAYMLGQSISEVADGIENAVNELMKMLE